MSRFTAAIGVTLATGLIFGVCGCKTGQQQPGRPSNAPPATRPVVGQEKYTWDSVTIKGNGFINGIVFSQAAPGLVYMHTDMGGAYRYDPASKKWVCLTDWVQYDDGSLAQMGVETMAADPTDANRVYVALGTYMGKSAILRSTDQGRTWQRTDVPFPMNGNGPGRNSGERMMVDPNQPSILFYGTRNQGLWKSTDYGATWNPVKSFPTTGDPQRPTTDMGIVWTLFDATSSTRGNPTKVIYAGVMTLSGPTVFRSMDAGETWSPIPGQPGNKLLPTRVAITPDGKTLYLTYIVGEGTPGPGGAIGGDIYRLTDPTSEKPTWTAIAPTTGRFGWSGITLDRQNPSVLLASVLSRYQPTDDIYRSTDGGQTWTGLNIDKNRDDSSAPYAKFMGTHWLGDVQIDPFDSSRAMYTTGYGLYCTTNATAEQPTWAFFNEGFEQSAVLELVSPPSGSANLLSAIGDRDGYRHEDLTVSPPHGHFGGEQKRTMGNTRDMKIAWSDPNVVVRSGGGRAQYSFDGGITWDWFKDPPAPATAPTTATAPASMPTSAPTTGPTTQRARRGWGWGWRRPETYIAITADGTRAIISAGSGTYYAVRSGTSWSSWKPVINDPGTSVTLIADTVNPKRLYARSGNNFFTSKDGGITWTRQTEKLPAGMNWVRVVIGHEGHLFGGVSLNRWPGAPATQPGLYRSTDSGKTWTKVADGLVKAANQVGIGAPAPGTNYPAIFVGGTVGDLNGFFRSDDQGATWVRINDDQHHYGGVTVIQGDSRVFGRLYVGANGRGILYGERKQ